MTSRPDLGSVPPPGGDSSREISLRASLLRVIFGILGTFVIPLYTPELAQYRWLFGSYLALALVQQVLIYKNIGRPTVRGFFGGLVDIAVVTFFVQRYGTVSQPTPYLYLIIAAANIVAVGRRVTYTLVGLSSAAYSSVVILEALRIIPYAPDGPNWLGGGTPDLADHLGPAGLFVGSLLVVTGVLGQLHRALRRREAELARSNLELEQLSRRDPLTQLYNRRYLLERIRDELERVRRGQSACLLMVDLDRFKQVNDQRGHEAGDQLLSHVADALRDATRKIDIVARYGGDEFVVLLPGTDAQGADAVSLRLLENVRAAGRGATGSGDVTASVGVAVANSSDNAASVLRRADELAYAAKHSGGDRVAAEESVEQSGRQRIPS